MPNTTRKVHSPMHEHTDVASADDGSKTSAPSVAQLMNDFEGAAYKSLSISHTLDTDQSTFKYFAADRAVDVGSRLGVPLFGDGNDLTRQKISTKATAVKRAAPLEASAPKADLLLWKFSEYPVSPYHTFCSTELKELKLQIESTLSLKSAEFDRASSLSYECVTWRSSTKVQFAVRVSKLQSSCQKVVGDKYVVELVKTYCSSPFTWRSFATDFMESLKRALAVSGTRKHRSSTFEELVDQKSLDMHSRQISRKYSLGKEDARELTRKYSMDREDLCSVLSKFLKAFVSNGLPPSGVEFTAVFAGLSEDLLSCDKSVEGLDHEDLSNLVALLTNGCNDLRRTACTIVRNVARAGLLRSLSDEDKEGLLTSLTRCINSLGEDEKFVLGLKREAVRAIAAMNTVFTPAAGCTREVAYHTLKACAASSDNSLARYANEAIQAYKFEDAESPSVVVG